MQNTKIVFFNFFKPLKDDLFKWRKNVIWLALFFSLIIIPGPLVSLILLSREILKELDLFYYQTLLLTLIVSIPFLIFIFIIFFSWFIFTFYICKKEQSYILKKYKRYFLFAIFTLNFIVIFFLKYIKKIDKIKNLEKKLKAAPALINIKKTNVIWKDKWFYYKLITTIFSWTAILFSYFYHLLNKIYIRDIDTPFSYFLYNDQFTSFWTHQTNLLVATWFTLALIFHNNKNHLIFKNRVLKNVTTYITVTSVTYLLIIYPFAFKNMDSIKQFIGLSLHLVVPLLMVFYTINHLGKQYNRVKNYWSDSKSEITIMLIYPIIYSIYIIVRFFIYVSLNLNLSIGFPYLPKKLDISFQEHDYNSKHPIIISLYFSIISAFIFLNLLFFINFNILYLKINNYKYLKNLNFQT